MNYLKENIPMLKSVSSITKINKGFSNDQKYVIDDKYLIRVFSSENKSCRQEEFHIIQKLNRFSDYVPEAIDFGTLSNMEQSYMILTYFPGEDGETSLKELTEGAQYKAGFTAGNELKKLHELIAPEDTPPWYEHKKQKTEKYLEELELINVEKSLKKMLTSCIRENEMLMKGRPNTFQHDDFHPANLLIHRQKFAGIIDFQRMDWGDPIHDLHKLGFFSSRISVPFTRGIVDGYHSDSSLGDSFWELYLLYSAIHIVSALVWGKRMGIYEKMLTYSMDVVRDHDHFERIVPKWYSDS
ncbi:aminoglycoside phosphotransferase family protein [Pseudogracilibacillus auburnensis]|uniref:Aminoglycoside phosphotransferase (APT) family kinase protein n=1 Tax=Pseudogracilibacillus auburnensis TaxID=1494959 RepID=A0A2V3W4V4_9BACI|nr:aminoglycoside phosphotransferase family protein [Pseudogracilibacillus auburnensis]MBO1005264.1 aminoglycoside phosphotransferase family protein [Pseudogracilibacillus auburnensis]PXW88118.1 aminoglycoside phosphotransferase (APT) family kinase protein [Pseudogracilibacillus auburnensis]